jgi:hypothetical protein
VQLDLKALWDGRLARPDWAGKMPTPQEIKGSNGKVGKRPDWAGKMPTPQEIKGSNGKVGKRFRPNVL